MPEAKGPMVGMQDVRELMPKGRDIYIATRDYVMRRPSKISALVSSEAADILSRITAQHHTMEPPLPDEVVGTIIEFSGQYRDSRPGDEKRLALERVGSELVSVVFEYGYGNLSSNPS